MSQRGYTTMNQQPSNMPSHGSAASSQVGNAREGFQVRKMGGPGPAGALRGEYTPGMAGGRFMQQSCHFPQAPPKRCYCQPAAFTSLDGRSHLRLLDAYGSSIPCAAFRG